MDSSKLNEWLQVIGLFGVIASLIFVGLQMIQDREIAKSEAFQARAQASAETLMSLSQNDAFVSVVANQYIDDPVSISQKDLYSATLAMIGGMYLWENSYYQFVEGFLPEEHWTRTRLQMATVLQNDFQRQVAASNLPSMRPAFREELKRVLAEVEADLNQ